MFAKSLVATLAAATLLAAGAAYAADEYNTVPGLTSAGAPLALHGVDPVAFVDLGVRIPGSSAHVAAHDGVAYYFDSAENRKRFEASPERYQPRFGGFCTFGVSVGKKFDGNPTFAAVENGELFVFLNETVYREFRKDPRGTIAKAEKNWKRIRSQAANAL